VDKKEWEFVPFGCRGSIFDRYRHDNNFRALVDQLQYILEQGYSTPSELREALILAATQIEFRTVHSQILDLHNYDIEDTVLSCVREKIKSEKESE
jgi:ribulose bisphosphate carboxylase small subunit